MTRRLTARRTANHRFSPNAASLRILWNSNDQTKRLERSPTVVPARTQCARDHRSRSWSESANSSEVHRRTKATTARVEKQMPPMTINTRIERARWAPSSCRRRASQKSDDVRKSAPTMQVSRAILILARELFIFKLPMMRVFVYQHRFQLKPRLSHPLACLSRRRSISVSVVSRRHRFCRARL